jgi:hypothetical protein
MEAVLEIDADDTDREDFGHGRTDLGRRRAVPGLQVRGDRYGDHVRDPPQRGERRVAGEPTRIRNPLGPRHPSTRRGDSLCPSRLNGARRARVPRVRQNQRPVVMHCPKGPSLCLAINLCVHFLPPGDAFSGVKDRPRGPLGLAIFGHLRVSIL